jgi:hypothetical protein
MKVFAHLSCAMCTLLNDLKKKKRERIEYSGKFFLSIDICEMFVFCMIHLKKKKKEREREKGQCRAIRSTSHTI